MKILYGIQGTGHGHISRAREIIPELIQHAEVDVLLSGYNCKMNLEDVEVTRKRGISLNYDSKGSVSFLKTASALKPTTFLRDIRELRTEDYDFVISDFEPVSAWAARRNGTHSVAMSHQASFLSVKSPRPGKRSYLGEAVLRYFAPCSVPLGFHFQRYDRFILPPVIRKDVRGLVPSRGNHITVYLPAFDPARLLNMFLQITETEWHLFSPECSEPYSVQNVTIFPVGNKPFLNSMKRSLGVVTGSGFETCAEAMFLGKKLLSIPIANQYEQYCNEAALKKMGVQTLRKVDASFTGTLRNWIHHSKVIQLREIADADEIVTTLLKYHNRKSLRNTDAPVTRRAISSEVLAETI